MKIVVLNGSPKGEVSVTVQYVRYLQKQFPGHELKILSVAHEINGLERDQAKRQTVMDEIESCDGVLWASPVYYFLVPSQLKRFIELIWERRAEEIFRGKYGAALVTSIHCMDHTAMNYLTGISEDLGMRFVGGLTPASDDLTVPKERTSLINFMAYFLHAIETGAPTPRSFAPVNYSPGTYRPADFAEATATPAGNPGTGDGKIVILTDGNDPESNLGRMISVFQRHMPSPVEVFDLNNVAIKGGCQGCIHCAYDNTCVYQDGVKQFIQEKLLPAKAIIYAGNIKDRYLSSRWKMYIDRTFVFGHTPYLSGKQIGFIISGPLRQLPNLRQIFEAHTQAQRCTLLGFATDEGDTETITAGLQALADRLVWALVHGLQAPPNYLGYGLHLLFKEFVPMVSGIFRADHIFYKKHGLYKDQHKGLRQRMMNLLFAAMNSLPKTRREFQKQMKPGMIADLKRIVDGAKPAAG
ncbi:NAD(P)H-dependent oxidoreductase [Pelotomaculum isophthalicicum JI]|uniref:NAD(P)H-dependent oxidoreductase n=1 Tax=Pelotomaculum isophthalicicum JI TaxID=947010 RepID=A0A9X4JVQ9_9FIRM|nr:NAD(P)H-dependent oxidoreductase [Pelotomaculum isophthalicicum]MDF9408801.1 NAD(P)H-dependent oxidoreductase [Pelotomaculum isophthalicicum JI]